jgi:hypothetical protein
MHSFIKTIFKILIYILAKEEGRGGGRVEWEDEDEEERRNADGFLRFLWQTKREVLSIAGFSLNQNS